MSYVNWGDIPIVKFSELEGQVITRIEGLKEGSERVEFHTATHKYIMLHHQSCCENVDIDEIHGDPKVLLNTPIVMADESYSAGDNACGTYTWTFYKLRTAKGDVTIKWYGESSGYYSEYVDFHRVENDGK